VKINDAVFGILLAVLAVAVLVTVQAYPKIPGQNVGPALFPGLVAAGLLVCGLLLIVQGMRGRQGAWIVLHDWTRSRRHLVAFVTLVAGVIAYILLADAVGFLIVAPLLLLAVFLSFGVRGRTAAIVAVVATVVIWYAFYKLLRVPLPWGVLEPFAF
jgi:putative tricarboxylic transport membrane protein